MLLSFQNILKRFSPRYPQLSFQLFSQLFLQAQQTPLWEDFAIIFERDPAARSGLEVLCCYPGLHAISAHRLAHWLHTRQVPFFPRFISHLARCFTGIEIHPGAHLGAGVFIDHGMGVVIGETAIVGDHTLIYQGVTLGGTGKETGKRHPTLGAQVVVGAGAKVLGNIHIGDCARIGAGSVVLNNVPINCTAVGVPSRNVCECNTADAPLEHGHLPDIEAATLQRLLNRIEQLENQLHTLKAHTLQKNTLKDSPCLSSPAHFPHPTFPHPTFPHPIMEYQSYG
ncbi:MAG: serine O-acetyltransferase [Cyanobacteria bacterium J06634_5]